MNFADRMKEQAAEQAVTITIDEYAEVCAKSLGKILDDVGWLMAKTMPLDLWAHFFKLYAIAVRDELFGGNDE